MLLVTSNIRTIFSTGNLTIAADRKVKEAVQSVLDLLPNIKKLKLSPEMFNE